MNNLLSAIMTKTTGSALSTAVGGRIYLDEAPDNSAYPNVVFLIVSSVPEKTFTESMTNTIIQFSLRSTSQSAAEITDMYADLLALFDEKPLTITGSTTIWMKWQNTVPGKEDVTTTQGTVGCKHWAVDFEILTSLN